MRGQIVTKIKETGMKRELWKEKYNREVEKLLKFGE